MLGEMPTPDASPEDPLSAKTRGGVLLAVRDLFFRVKLETALRNLDVSFRTAGPEGFVAATLAAAAAGAAPAVVVLDLSDGSPVLEALRELRGRPELADLPVIGFAPHADRQLREAAARAGCNVVVPRSRIAAALPEVLAPFLQRLGTPR